MIYINPYSVIPSFTNLYSNELEGGVSGEYASAGDNAAFSFTDGAGTDTAYTWVMWMKRAAIGVNSALLSKWSDSGNNREWYSAIIGSTWRFLIYNAAGTAFIGRTAPMATTGSWVGLAGTYTASETSAGIKLYTITGGTVTQIDTANLESGVYAGMSNTASALQIGSLFSGAQIWFFNGKLYHPQLWTGALSTTDLGTIGTNPHQDVRTFSFGANAISAWKYNAGTADYPTWTDYVNSRNATMIAQENTDINTDIP